METCKKTVSNLCTADVESKKQEATGFLRVKCRQVIKLFSSKKQEEKEPGRTVRMIVEQFAHHLGTKKPGNTPEKNWAASENIIAEHVHKMAQNPGDTGSKFFKEVSDKIFSYPNP